MLKKKQIGSLAIYGLVFLNIILWIAFSPEDTIQTNYSLQFLGEAIASTVMILISFTLILSARPRFLEPFFGGLDQMWQTHKKISMSAFLLLIFHFFTIPKTDTLINGKPIGMLAFIGMVILVFLTVAPRVPVISRVFKLNYTKWRIAHKLLGVFFILGLVHYLLVETISKQTVPGLYMMMFSFIGILAFLYRQFFSRMFEPYQNYSVESVERLNGQVVDFTMSPIKKGISYSPGQFAYIYFKANRKLREPHPFTISSSPDDKNLRFSIKSSGDWTNFLVNNLEVGAKAAVHGGFGMLDYTKGNKDQIWIAGGIGITPFLSWIRSFPENFDHNVRLFYSVRGQEDALYWDEIKTIEDARSNFTAHLQTTSRDGYLSANEIINDHKGDLSKTDVYICGPIQMMESYSKKLKELGVPSGNIHFEEFSFR